MLDRAIFLASDGTAPPLPEYSEPVHEGSGRTRPRVLVVDDEQLIAQTVAAILNANGFEAQEAYSGEEALAAAHRF
ncbi:MAG: response regulator, partial [Acidobacteriaceae bacterium]